MSTSIEFWQRRFKGGGGGNVLDLEIFWVLGRGAVIAAWGYQDDLERAAAYLVEHAEGVDDPKALAQHFRELAIGAPRKLGENAKLPPLPADWDLDAELPEDALPKGDDDDRTERGTDQAKDISGVRPAQPRRATGTAHDRPDSGGTLERGDLEMKHKGIDVGKVKAGADDGLGEGEFIAYASIFGNVDSAGDVVQPGAFAKSIEAWAKSGNTLPILYGHDAKNPHMNVGGVVTMVEDDRGLKVHGKFDLDTETGAQIYRLVKGRRLSQLSFAYDEIRTRPVKGDPRLGNYKSLDELHVHEISLVPIGANRQTAVVAVKAEANGPSVKAWDTYFTAAKFAPVSAPA